MLFSATKVFYYDSIDDIQRDNETLETFEARIREQEAALREINAVPNTHVRYGSVTGRDRRKRRQKEVDILIAVDMMNHAVRQNMDRAVLLTGDRDFTPLVETLVQLGLTVQVAGDHRYTSDILREAADHYLPLAVEQYTQLVDPHERQRMPPFPSFASGVAPVRDGTEPLATGLVAKETGRVLFDKSRNSLVFEIASRYNARHVYVDRMSLGRLYLFLELQYAGMNWLREFMEHQPE